MRYLCVILSFYLLALSIVPCADSFECFSQKKAPVIAALHAGDRHDCSGNEDCSPLCICSCCAGFVFSSENLHIIPVQNFIEYKLPLFSSKAFYGFKVSIWQPPKA